MFTRQSKMTLLMLIWMLPVTAVLAEKIVVPQPGQSEVVEIAAPEPDLSEGIEIAELEVTSRIEGRELSVSLDFEAVTKSSRRRMLLIQGDAFGCGPGLPTISRMGLEQRLSGAVHAVLLPAPHHGDDALIRQREQGGLGADLSGTDQGVIAPAASTVPAATEI